MNLRNFVLLSLMLFLAGCQGTIQGAVVTDAPSCVEPMILVGEDCCLDENSNSICDEFEEKVEINVEEEKVEVEEKSENKVELKEEKVDFKTPEEVEEQIIEALADMKTYYFRDVKRDNLTGIENTFELRKSVPERLYVMKINKKYNHLNEFSDFENFSNRLYDLTVKNWNIWGNEEIDYNKLFGQNWKHAKYDYEHSLDEIEINNHKVLFEDHLLTFWKPNDIAMNGWFEIKTLIWCTPEIFIEVWPSEISTLGWTGKLKDAKQTARNENEVFKKGIFAVTEKVVEVCDNPETKV